MRSAKLRRLALVLLCIVCLTSCLRASQPPVVVIQFPINGTTHLQGTADTFPTSRDNSAT